MMMQLSSEAPVYGSYATVSHACPFRFVPSPCATPVGATKSSITWSISMDSASDALYVTYRCVWAKRTFGSEIVSLWLARCNGMIKINDSDTFVYLIFLKAWQ
jgi:hypothetical protein